MDDVKYRFTRYFEQKVLVKRPYLKKKWCIDVVESPLEKQKQEDDRVRFWGEVEELPEKVLRVITMEDETTIHNAFPDRNYRKK